MTNWNHLQSPCNFVETSLLYDFCLVDHMYSLWIISIYIQTPIYYLGVYVCEGPNDQILLKYGNK